MAVPLDIKISIVAAIAGDKQLEVGEACRLLAPLSCTSNTWRQAIRQTPLELCISEGTCLSSGAIQWLSRVCLKGLSLSTSPAEHLAEHPELLQQALAASGPRLLRLSGPASLHLLPALRLSSLHQLDLCIPQPRHLVWVPELADLQPAVSPVDLSLLGGMHSLRQLSISGHFQLAHLHRLPHGLTHLRLSSHSRQQLYLAGTPVLSLPPLMRLVRLSVKARAVSVGGWGQLCRQVGSLQLTASRLVLGMQPSCGDSGSSGGGTSGSSGGGEWQGNAFGSSGGDAMTPEGGSSGLDVGAGEDLALYRAFAREVASACQLGQVLLQFQKMQLWGTLSKAAGEPGLISAWVDGHEVVASLRDELVGSHSIASYYASCSFDSDGQPHAEVATVLKLDRQPEGAPKSFWFLTPATSKEQAMMQHTPLAALEWCCDPCARSLLANPSFISQSARTLRVLGPISLTPGLDLSPLAHLTELHGLLEDPAAGSCPALLQQAPLPPSATDPRSAEPLHASGTALPQPAVHAVRAGPAVLPPLLCVLGLQAWDAPAPHFDAAMIASLASLRELRLGGFASHDLCALPHNVSVLTLTNPRPVPPSLPLGAACLLLPSWGRQQGAPSMQSAASSGDSGSSSAAGRAKGGARRPRWAASCLGACFGAQQQAAAGAAGSGGLPSAAAAPTSGHGLRAQEGPVPEHLLLQQEAGGMEGAPAGQPGSAPALGPAPAPALHLHVTSSTAAELAVDLSWALSQPALRQLTITGSGIRPDQELKLHLSGRPPGRSLAAAARQLAQHLACAPGLEAITIIPNMATATLQAPPSGLLRHLGIPPARLPLGQVLAAAAASMSPPPTGNVAPSLASSASSSFASGTSARLASSGRPSRSQQQAPELLRRGGSGTAGQQAEAEAEVGEALWRVESRVVREPYFGGGEEGEEGRLEWVAGARVEARGIRLVRTHPG